MASAQDPRGGLLLRHFFNRVDRVAVAPGRGAPCAAEVVSPLAILVQGHVFGNDAESGSVRISGRRRVEKHGRFRVGSYAPGPDGKTRWLCFDLDGPGHAAALADPLQVALTVHQTLAQSGLASHLERSGGGRGWHLWVLFKEPIPATKARALGLALVPNDAPLVQGGCADAAKGKGIEIFPKRDRVAKGGFGSMVWLPWWHGAGEGASQFYRQENGNLEQFTPEAFETVEEATVDACLQSLAPAKKVSRPQRRGRAGGNGIKSQQLFKVWCEQALAALDLKAVYGEWLTGRSRSKGWLECRDPDSPSGDRNPSAGVADGTGEAEKATFHSFRDDHSESVFKFLTRMGRAQDFRHACEVVARMTGVPLPNRSPARSPTVGQAEEAASSLPKIEVNGRQTIEVVEDAWSAIRRGSTPRRPLMLLRAGRLVHVHEDRGIEDLSEDSVRSILMRAACWYQRRSDDLAPCPPPLIVVKDMLASPCEGLPVVEHVVRIPVFGGDGRLLVEPGYHAGERLWYEPSSGPIADHSVPDGPNSEHVDQARAILEELVQDFPFASEADRTHWVCALLLPIVRPLIAGQAPALLIEAAAPGTGKTLLAKLIQLIVTGSEGLARTWPDSEEEVRKAITAMLLSGAPVHLIDNLPSERPLSSPNLAALLTSRRWADRHMCTHKGLTVANDALWILTGNNPCLSDELVRRCLRCRIVAPEEHPEQRGGFRHPDLLPWVEEHRAELLEALCTLVQAWIAAGRPACATKFGGFESWVQVIGGIVTHAGFGGFLAQRWVEVREPRSEAMGEFYVAWWDTHGDVPVPVGVLATLAERDDLCGKLWPDRTPAGIPGALGLLLREHRDQVLRGYRAVLVDQATRHNGVRKYRLERVGGLGG